MLENKKFAYDIQLWKILTSVTRLHEKVCFLTKNAGFLTRFHHSIKIESVSFQVFTQGLFCAPASTVCSRSFQSFCSNQFHWAFRLFLNGWQSFRYAFTHLWYLLHVHHARPDALSYNIGLVIVRFLEHHISFVDTQLACHGSQGWIKCKGVSIAWDGWASGLRGESEVGHPRVSKRRQRRNLQIFQLFTLHFVRVWHHVWG